MADIWRLGELEKRLVAIIDDDLFEATVDENLASAKKHLQDALDDLITAEHGERGRLISESKMPDEIRRRRA